MSSAGSEDPPDGSKSRLAQPAEGLSRGSEPPEGPKWAKMASEGAERARKGPRKGRNRARKGGKRPEKGPNRRKKRVVRPKKAENEPKTAQKPLTKGLMQVKYA